MSFVGKGDHYVANSRISGRKFLEVSAARGSGPVRGTTRWGPYEVL